MRELLEDYRCECGKLLLRGLILTGGVEVKCKFCKKLTVIDGLIEGLSTDVRYILFLDEDGTIVRASTATRKHTGFDSRELIGKHAADHIMMLNPRFYEVLWEALGTPKKTSALFNTLQIHKDKSLTPVTVDAQPSHIRGSKYLVFSVEKKTSHESFGAGGTL